MKKVVVANDHGAVELAGRVVSHLKKRGFEVNYLGTSSLDSVDYPDIAVQACDEYLRGGYEFGVVCCGTGIGISICANKIRGIICALPQNAFACAMAKEHNNANFLAFGGRIEYQESVEAMLDSFIDTKVSDNERHVRRREKMLSLDR